MRFNRETWYSKLIAILLFFTFPIAAFYLGVKYQKSTLVQRQNTSIPSPAPIEKGVTFETTYEDNLLKYQGTVALPSPCHDLKQEAKVMVSYPEQVRIDLTVENPAQGTVCTQQITTKEFSSQVQVSEKATISVFLNGEKVY